MFLLGLSFVDFNLKNKQKYRGFTVSLLNVCFFQIKNESFEDSKLNVEYNLVECNFVQRMKYIQGDAVSILYNK